MEAIALLTRHVQASTGPRAFTRGLRRITAAASIPHTGRFNGAARFHARIAAKPFSPQTSIQSFNGAARFHARIVSGRRDMPVAEIGFNGAARFHARIEPAPQASRGSRRNASTGPRAFTRGLRQPPRGGRSDLPLCFNGAARFHARIAGSGKSYCRAHCSLQRGRALSRAD